MHRSECYLATIAALSLLVGCNKAQSPETVQKNVDQASAEAADKTAAAQTSQAKTDASANDSLSSAEANADAKKADAAADTEVAEAEGRNKVALAKCEALSGDLQQACKEKANALLDVAKANAKAMKAHQN